MADISIFYWRDLIENSKLHKNFCNTLEKKKAKEIKLLVLVGTERVRINNRTSISHNSSG